MSPLAPILSRSVNLALTSTCSREGARRVRSRGEYALDVPGAGPSHDYYRACEGRWECPFELVITDPAAFRACAMRWLDRLRIRSMLLGARWSGPFVFRTTVDYA